MVSLVACGATFLMGGNLSILGFSLWAQATSPMTEVATDVPGVEHLVAVDRHLWRGSAPSRDGYAALAAAGVTTVVDLRAEEDVHVDERLLADLGIDLERIPIRDGQAPSAAKVRRFIDVAEESDGRVFVHCGAGVGRAGTMAAAWLVHTGSSGGLDAVRRNLAIGPPSLEQLAFVRDLDDGPDKPSAPLVAVSRFLDAPRRLWSRYGL